MVHTAQLKRIRSKFDRTVIYVQGACSCGWRGGHHSTRTVEGWRLGERDAIDHAGAANKRELSATR